MVGRERRSGGGEGCSGGGRDVVVGWEKHSGGEGEM